MVSQRLMRGCRELISGVRSNIWNTFTYIPTAQEPDNFALDYLLDLLD